MTFKIAGKNQRIPLFQKKCLNVSQKLGTWKFFNVFLRFPMFSNIFQCYLLSCSLSLTISLSHSLTLSHSHTLSLSLNLSLSLFLTLTLFQSLIQSLSTCWATFVFISMLKSRCLLQKWQCFFLDINAFFLTKLYGHQQHPFLFLSVSRAGSQLIRNNVVVWPVRHNPGGRLNISG